MIAGDGIVSALREKFVDDFGTSIDTDIIWRLSRSLIALSNFFVSLGQRLYYRSTYYCVSIILWRFYSPF